MTSRYAQLEKEFGYFETGHPADQLWEQQRKGEPAKGDMLADSAAMEAGILAQDGTLPTHQAVMKEGTGILSRVSASHQEMVVHLFELERRLMALQKENRRLLEAQTAHQPVAPRPPLRVLNAEGTRQAYREVILKSVPFFDRKNRQYDNAIWATGAEGAVTAMTGDIARLRVMLRAVHPDVDNLRDKFQDIMVQAAIGIVMLENGNMKGVETV